jgi:acyl-CoA hydrolase
LACVFVSKEIIMNYQNKLKTLDEIITLFSTSDSLTIPLATGQPMALLNALSDRQDWEKLEVFCGLLSFPYPLLSNPNVYIKSGYYGPIERYLNEAGSHMEYLPANFRGFETYALRKPTHFIATTLSAPDEEGYLTFGTHGAAAYKPFIAACHSDSQIAIAEINTNMPTVYGDTELGDNKIHIDEIDVLYQTDNSQSEVPEIPFTDKEIKIADNVLNLIENQATLQFGIGAIPNLIAEKLTKTNLGEFGVHSELISDGFLALQQAGKITNKHKGIYDGKSVFTFAFGKKSLYDFLDEKNGNNNRSAICLPVSTVNNPHIIAQNKKFTSINSGLMIDFSGQVSSEAIGLRQYSGVGGQLSFVQGAGQSLDGKSVLCIKSTATVKDKLVSNIMPTLPTGSIVSTPRHFTQYIVTEYGIADLYGVSDEKRADKLIQIAHPDFRDELREEFEKMRKIYYKN